MPSEISEIVKDISSDMLINLEMEQQGFVDLSPKVVFLFYMLKSERTLGVLKNASDFSGTYVKRFGITGGFSHGLIEERTRIISIQYFYKRIADFMKYNGDVPDPYFDLRENQINDYISRYCHVVENHRRVGRHFKNLLDIAADKVRWQSVLK